MHRMDIKFLPDLVDGLATAQCLKRKTAVWRLTKKIAILTAMLKR